MTEIKERRRKKLNRGKKLNKRERELKQFHRGASRMEESELFHLEQGINEDYFSISLAE